MSGCTGVWSEDSESRRKGERVVRGGEREDAGPGLLTH